MRNFEKCEKELLEHIEKHGQVPAVDKNRNFVVCSEVSCSDCENYKQGIGCFAVFIKWLYEECKEPKYPKLTRLQYELLKKYSERYEWIVRDIDLRAYLTKGKPHKDQNVWKCIGSSWLCLEKILDDFDFVKWEDTEPWNIKELLENCEVEE